MTTGNPTHVAARYAQCTSCHHKSTFTYAGEQRWPQRLVRALNMPSSMHLWTCSTCQSTIVLPQ